MYTRAYHKGKARRELQPLALLTTINPHFERKRHDYTSEDVNPVVEQFLNKNPVTLLRFVLFSGHWKRIFCFYLTHSLPGNERIEPQFINKKEENNMENSVSYEVCTHKEEAIHLKWDTENVPVRLRVERNHGGAPL